MLLQPSQVAPLFSLYDSGKIKISLSDYKGKNVLILFFPLAFTSVCTAELCDVRDNMSKYETLNVQILGISVDSLYSLKKYKEEMKLNFPLLSDFNKEVSTLYGCLYDLFSYDMKGVSKRSAFIIDRDGIIRYAEVLEDAGKVPDFNAIQECLLTFV